MIRTLTVALALIAVLTLGVAPSHVLAQSNDQSNHKTQTLTGCIQRGDGVSTYKLFAKNGIWNLSGGDKLKIGLHVDHTVTIRGKIIESFDTKPADKENTSAPRLGILRITKITMVSDTCAP